MIDTIVYHGDCPDGFCAAYVAHHKWPDATLVPATYGKPIDEMTILGWHVLVVDFSWKRTETERLASIAASVTILDHHKTAEAELTGLPYATFDMERSGAQLAWDYCYPNATSRPWFVNYVADRDLWRWALPQSKEVNAYLMSLPHTIKAWAEMDTSETLTSAAVLGRGARAQVDHYVEKVCAQAYKGTWTVLADEIWNTPLKLLIVNAAYPNISDTAHELCSRGAQIGIGWFVRGDGLIQFSLRSIGDLDVSALAKMHGGGGHKNAAGFQLPFHEGLTLLQGWTRR